MNEFDKILKDATCDVLISMFKDDVARDLVDSCYDYDDCAGMDVKKAIRTVRITQNDWAGVMEDFKEEGLI